MFADLINQLAKTYQEERKGDYYARPSSAGPEKCIRALAYNAIGVKGSRLPGRAILTFDDSSWHEELTLDWMKKTAFSNHSDQMPVDLPAPGINITGHFCRICKKDIAPEIIHGHIDWIATDPLGRDWLVEHKALSRFGSQRCEKELPMDYLSQASIYSAALQRIQPDLTRVTLIIKNKDTAQYIEFECVYEAVTDIMVVNKRIISKGDSPADIVNLNVEIKDIVGDALKKFREVDKFARDKTVPPRQYDRNKGWQCDYCAYSGPCYEGYEEEFNSLSEEVDINEDIETDFKYYLQLGSEARESKKSYEGLRDKIKDRLKDAGIRAGKTKNYTAKITISSRDSIDKTLIPADLMPKFIKTSTSEKLTIRLIKKEGGK